MSKIHVRITRDTVLLIAGVFLLVSESLNGTDRPYLIAAAVTLCGLPFALWGDRMMKNGSPKKEGERCTG